MVNVGSFEEFALLEGGAGADQGDQVLGFHGAPAGLCGLDELERHRHAGRSHSGPLVPRCRSRTVAKVDSIGFVVRR